MAALPMTDTAFAIVSESVAQTLDIGRRVGTALLSGDVVGLVGRLGAGKTYLVKGIAAGLGVTDDRVVNSPTFVLVNEYAGRATIHHIDAYRLSDPDELLDLGFEEMCDGRAVVIVEWADRVANAMPDRTLWIRLEATAESTRSLRLECPTTDAVRRLRTALDPKG